MFLKIRWILWEDNVFQKYGELRMGPYSRVESPMAPSHHSWTLDAYTHKVVH
jgi:hypothetical protein